MDHKQESVIFTGKPSQLINTGSYFKAIACFILVLLAPTLWDQYLASLLTPPQYKEWFTLTLKVFFLVIPLWVMVIWLKTHCHRYIVTTERLTEEMGILTKNAFILELYRVKDITSNQPFFLRMFGYGNIILNTSDRTNPIVFIQGIKNHTTLINTILQHVEQLRTTKGVREID